MWRWRSNTRSREPRHGDPVLADRPTPGSAPDARALSLSRADGTPRPRVRHRPPDPATRARPRRHRREHRTLDLRVRAIDARGGVRAAPRAGARVARPRRHVTGRARPPGGALESRGDG